jgi:hypothetical protein
LCDAPCRATFAALKSDEFKNCRAVHLDEKQPNCRCQQLSVSEFSIGPVENREKLLRLLMAPQHHGKNGQPKASALTDAERNGLSVFREAQATDDRRVATGLVNRAREGQSDIKKKAKIGVFGVLNMTCSAIRQFIRESELRPCYCVYDTAQPDIPSHAETFQCVASVDQAVCEDRRRQLFTIVQPTFVPVADFRKGLLKDLAPIG